MNRKNKWIIYGIGISLLLGGCMNMDNANGNGVDEQKEPSKEMEKQLVSVQNYKGEGYTLPNGEEMDKIAEDNKDEVESAVKSFYKENYKTDIKVHNIVGNEDGATVFVESIGRLHYYTYAIVPIDIDTKKIHGDKVFSEEGQVEDGIKGGLYRLIFQEQFDKLDSYFKDLVSEGEVVGKTEESLQNVGGTGYMTPYYFISTFNNDESIKPVFDIFVKNPEADIEELKSAYVEGSFSPENLLINVRLFMKDKDASPSEEIFKRVANDLERIEGIPKGSYSLYLNDNKVYKDSFTGEKENSLSRGHGNYIVKN
ncbi:DUF1672 family protein [Rossellomorea vietnamensis]|uniref:DUF1672 family protein n=1 Tax=Rossellomorea vietnamensis TaxID=218284 RepID=UPI001E352127|nr:DUF1672 family protein [Rossellomorea vietnamensis]MCC5804325.1 DUF1672 family protein [Rossellomorea vietnamensis]